MEQNIPISPGSAGKNPLNNLIIIGVIVFAILMLVNALGIFADSDTDEVLQIKIDEDGEVSIENEHTDIPEDFGTTGHEVPYYIEGTSSVWIPVDLPASGSTSIIIEKVEGYAPNVEEVFDFADEFDTDLNKWMARSDGPGGNTIIDLEDGKLLLGAYGDYYTSPKIAYVRSVDSYELPVSIKFKSDQPSSSSEGKWWYAGFFISPMTKLTAAKGGHFWTPEGVEVAQADDAYRDTKTAINIIDRVDSETIETYYSNPDNPGTHEFQLDIFDDGTIDVYIDDVKVTTQGNHSLPLNNNYLYFARNADQSIWNKQTFHYIYVKKAAKNPPTTIVTDMGDYYKVEIQNNEDIALTDFQVEISASELDVWTSDESLRIKMQNNDDIPLTESQMEKT
ncbi:hypothetical protein [uncultured Methanolobus sp.]|uniref:hypothetical protein n=1 Tax=uncultured Methanolobus sp. TaxID=218300 RepID=UPI002AABE3EE|nr:hypothetical protein [uncultured Methanolobus sp.]